MAGTVVADTFQSSITGTPPQFKDGVGTQIGTLCRAFVNFNGTTVTNPASMTGVRGSFNVSSILDNGTGDYTINFTTAMPDANYSLVGATGNNSTLSGGAAAVQIELGPLANQTTSSVRVFTGRQYAAYTVQDIAQVNVAIFR